MYHRIRRVTPEIIEKVKATWKKYPTMCGADIGKLCGVGQYTVTNILRDRYKVVDGIATLDLEKAPDYIKKKYGLDVIEVPAEIGGHECDKQPEQLTMETEPVEEAKTPAQIFDIPLHDIIIDKADVVITVINALIDELRGFHEKSSNGGQPYAKWTNIQVQNIRKDFEVLLQQHAQGVEMDKKGFTAILQKIAETGEMERRNGEKLDMLNANAITNQKLLATMCEHLEKIAAGVEALVKMQEEQGAVLCQIRANTSKTEQRLENIEKAWD